MDKKPEKLVPEVRFKGFTDDWEQHKLGDITIPIKTYPYTRKYETKNITKFKYIHYGDIHTGKAKKINEPSKLPSITKGNYSTLRNGDVVVADASEDYKGIADAAILLSTGAFSIIAGLHTIAFRPNRKLVFPMFIYYNLQTSRFKHYGYHVGTGLKVFGISSNLFFDYSAFHPSLIEQQEISKLIESLENLLSLQQRKLEQLRQLKIFSLQRMFIDKDCKQPILRFKNFNDNWLPHKFNDIANTFSGGTPAISNKDYYGGNIPFIRSAEINKNTTQLHLTPDGLKNSSAKFIKKGTLLYALYGATSGEVGIAQIDGAINQAVMAINLKKDNVYFIKTWLIKNKRKIISTYLQGGQGNLSAKIVKHLKLSLPKIEEENLISITIMKIDSLIKLQQSKIDQLTILKKYLLQKLFI
ncbi:restriction endonuclease subunit S [Limosilactobacillus reuteri]|uniref:restriction endonuclease subunit S n=1 Tax=Limosilactobacillus reuteri TaxID=1598 RepID=UPI00128D7962|nr:restriction endonuclease subunit S [Limosilactobacillus reuteri]MCC4482174.1 restriction endonuclease subunit S [Limosilactobacillus reuteri]MQB88522.1 restriction endonuclease subunit S [Limosilactobacillus reuteri]